MSRPFVRVYYEDLARDYPEVYANDAALSTWLRLLVIVDKMWPNRPELPRSARPRALAVLTESGLVTLAPPHHYRIRGYEAERLARQAHARKASIGRWSNAPSSPQSNAPSNAQPMPTRARTEYRVPSTEFSIEKNGEKRARGGPERVGQVLPRVVS